MMNPNQVQFAEKSLWLVHITRLWTCAINGKKQALRTLKKSIDDA
jgi:hypothetical protein